MGCNCSKGIRAANDIEENNNKNKNVKERRSKPNNNNKTSKRKKKKKKSASSSKANVGSEESAGFINGSSNEATLKFLIPTDATKNNASSDDAEKKENLERKSSRSIFQRRPTTEDNNVATLQQPKIARINSVSNGEKGAQVMAGWPSWLAAVAGEAINGWIPRKADSFEKLEKVTPFFIFTFSENPTEILFH